jgi:thiamine biosynthesis lipoprotein
MGSQVNVWLECAEDDQVVLQQVPGWIEAIEASLSRFRPGNELSRLNSHSGAWVPVSTTMYAAVAEALRAAHATDGLVTPLVLPALLAAGYDRSFDTLGDQPSQGAWALTSEAADHHLPVSQWKAIQLDTCRPRVRLPGPIDLGGTAKGWSAEVIANRLSGHGPCLVDLGGDLVGRGKPWPIQVHDPFQPNIPFATFMLADRAVATSGSDYRRWGAGQHHIIDPRSGAPAQSDLLSVTVIHPDAVLAEGYAKAVLLRGSKDGLAWLAQQPDAAGLAFDHEGRVLASESFQPYLAQGA